jgi:NAD+ synthase
VTTASRISEDRYGIAYEGIDDFLEGKPVNEHVYTTIYHFYDATRYKGGLPVTTYDCLVQAISHQHIPPRRCVS